ncbi:DUF3489 domain-containing protein [Thauera sp. SWB20]|uniref:DUF3489 domain-containing protein n=1 Tax=Thauera sp. SWB20 TaxID=1572758 RepID=UPI0005ADCF5B|nr:DUF3489 domain-containing protein [Thauera sp. SWB20]KIN88267.1 hypothetical protein PO78_840 [Thauera sp. SWB20]
MDTIALTAAQQLLLTRAADLHGGKVVEFPTGVRGGARNKILQALLARDLVRADGDDWLMTTAGYAAIGREAPAAPAAPCRTRQHTKQAFVIEMLHRPEGATLAQICASTGWLAHTVRGALSGTLRKKLGLAIISEKRADGERTYRIVWPKPRVCAPAQAASQGAGIQFRPFLRLHSPRPRSSSGTPRPPRPPTANPCKPQFARCR